MVTIAKTIQPVRMPRFGHRVDKTDPILRGCVGWWPLNDGAGTKAVDLSGNGNDGTQSGGVSWTADDKGASASFDGVDDYITANTPTISQPATISAWFKATPGINGYVIDGDDASDRLAIFFNSARLFYYAGGSSINLGTAYMDGEWHHIAVTFDTVETAYIDGSLVLSASSGSNQLSGITIGNRYALNDPLNGNIQNVRIYNRALSAAEISRLYTEPWAGLEPLSPFTFFSGLSQIYAYYSAAFLQRLG